MIFTIFRDFSDFIFYLKAFKINKKLQKAFNNRTGPTWVRRGTQGHVEEPRGPAQCLRGALYILYSYITYSIMGFHPSVDRKSIQPIRSLGLINPTISFLLFRVGLIHTAFTMQVTWRDEEQRIKRAINRRALIACAVDHRRINQACAI